MFIASFLQILVAHQEVNELPNLSDVAANGIAKQTVNFASELRNILVGKKTISGNPFGDTKFVLLFDGNSSFMEQDENGFFKIKKEEKVDIDSKKQVSDYCENKLDQITKGKTIRVSSSFFFGAGILTYLGGSNHDGIKIIQVLGNNSMLIRLSLSNSLGSSSQTFLMLGEDTTKFVDGESLYSEKLYIISGTAIYKTAIGGSNKVYVMRPVEPAAFKLASQKIVELMKKQNEEFQKEIELNKKNEMEKVQAKKKAEILAIELAEKEKNQAVVTKGNKFITALSLYSKRFKDSSNEKNDNLKEQMQSQSRSFVLGDGKRMPFLIKEIESSSLDMETKKTLIKNVKSAMELSLIHI